MLLRENKQQYRTHRANDYTEVLCGRGFLLLNSLLNNINMKVSEKQLIVLFDIAKYSLQIIGNVAGYDENTRRNLVNDILNQQSNELIDVKTEQNGK